MTSVLFTKVRIIDGTGAQPYRRSLVQGNRISPWAGARARCPPPASPSSTGPAPPSCRAWSRLTRTSPGNDAANLSDLQRLPLEEHVLWSASVPSATRGPAGPPAWGGVRQAAAPTWSPARINQGLIPGPRYLAASQEITVVGGLGDETLRTCRSRVQLRGGGDRAERCGRRADVPEVRGRLDQAQPLGATTSCPPRPPATPG